MCAQGNTPVVVQLDVTVVNRSLCSNFRSPFNAAVAAFFLLNAILSACMSLFLHIKKIRVMNDVNPIFKRNVDSMSLVL